MAEETTTTTSASAAKAAKEQPATYLPAAPDASFSLLSEFRSVANSCRNSDVKGKGKAADDKPIAQGAEIDESDEEDEDMEEADDDEDVRSGEFPFPYSVDLTN
jgi:hypothetical protein